jgi:hypothetical protein
MHAANLYRLQTSTSELASQTVHISGPGDAPDARAPEICFLVGTLFFRHRAVVLVLGWEADSGGQRKGEIGHEATEDNKGDGAGQTAHE